MVRAVGSVLVLASNLQKGVDGWRSLYSKQALLQPAVMSLLIPDELVQASGLSEAELLQELVLLLFQREKLTLGKVSRLLGMIQLEFQALLASHDLYIHYDVEDLHEDIRSLKELGLL